MTLRTEHVEVLRVRGVSAALAETHEVYSVSAAEANAILRRHDVTCGGIAIPYAGTDLVVVRLDVPLRLPNGHEMKYALPVGSSARLYAPPETCEKLAADADRPLIIAEGPLKALSLLDVGFAVVGLVSCTTWSVPRREAEDPDGPRELHGDFAALPVSGRPLVVMLDEDAAWKRTPADEERKFLAALRRAGLTAKAARVPRIRGFEKAGIDDHIARIVPGERPALVERLVAEAKPLEELPPLTESGLLLERFDAAVFDVTPDGKRSDAVRIEAALRAIGRHVEKAKLDDIGRTTFRDGLSLKLVALGAKSPSALADALLKRTAVEAGGGLPGKTIEFEKLEPWPEPVEGAALLDEIKRFLEKYVVFPEHGAVAVALWCLATHVLDAFSIFARLAFTSATKQCGKSNALRLVAALVPKPLTASNTSAASVYRVIEKYGPTLCFDEVETILAGNEELRGILNSSHEKGGAFVHRCVGEGANIDVAAFSTWAAIAVACIGKLPGTLEDRSIEVRMRRRTRAEKVSLLRADRIGDEARNLRRKAARWAADHLQSLREADPDVPRSLGNRAADNWRPLLAVAERAGGRWPALARAAAEALSGGDGTAADGPGVELLQDIRAVFMERREKDRLLTEDLLKALTALEERPWRTWRRGLPLDARGLARLLGAFGVRSRDIRTPERESPLKGYLVVDFKDAWSRYFPEPSAEKPTPASSSPPEGGSGSATPRQPSILAGSSGIGIRDNGNPVADANCLGIQEKSGLSRCRGSETPPGAGSGVAADPLAFEEGVE